MEGDILKNAIIFGPLGAGKTTLAGMLLNIHCELTGEFGRIYSLGKKLKEIVDELKGKKGNRKEYQETGQFFRKLLGDDVWNECAFQTMKEKQIYPAIIDDGRQRAEFEYWEKKGFVQIGVVAPADVRARRVEERDGYCQTDRFNHEVEIQAEMIAYECDIVVCNYGNSLENLYDIARGIYFDHLKEVEVHAR
jgi:dephospho-CoA kinase